MSTGFKIRQDIDFSNKILCSGFSIQTSSVFASPINYSFPTTTPFTLECWVNLNTYTSNAYMMYNNTFGGLNFYVDGTGIVAFDIPGPGRICATTATVSLNTWTHLALAKTGSNYTIFINGVASATGSSSQTLGVNGDIFFFNGVSGFVSNLRLVSGTNLYPINFSPPLDALSAISGTVILLAQSTTIRDSGPNNVTLIVSASNTYAIYLEPTIIDVDDILVRREYFSDGSLWYWNNTTMSPVTAAGSGLTWKFITSGRGIFGVKSDGTLWTWGNNQASTPTQVSFAGYTNNDWKSFACGYQGSGSQESYIGIKNDGNIWAWGGNAVGQLGVGDSVNKSSPVTAVGGGGWKQVVMGVRTDNVGSTMGIKTDGTLWYMNVSPVQVAGGGTWKQVATNEGSIAIKTDGTMWTWSGTSSPTTWAAAGSKTWKYIHANYRTAHAVSTDGSLWSWGNNTNGILGDGTTTDRTSFVSVAGGGTNWKSVFACGYWSTVVGLKTDGTLWSWGPIPGDGTAVAKSSPVLVAGGFTNWRSVPIGSTGGPFNAAPIMMIQDLTI